MLIDINFGIISQVELACEKKISLKPIVAFQLFFQFNFYPDHEQVLQNMRKLKGTKIGIGEQFPDGSLKICKELYPELKKARHAGKKAKLRDRYFTSRQHDANTKYRISLDFVSLFIYYLCIIISFPLAYNHCNYND
jgi:hypothetical protein